MGPTLLYVRTVCGKWWKKKQRGERVHVKKTWSDKKNLFNWAALSWKVQHSTQLLSQFMKRHHGDCSVKDIVKDRPSDMEECYRGACLPVWHRQWSHCSPLKMTPGSLCSNFLLTEITYAKVCIGWWYIALGERTLVSSSQRSVSHRSCPWSSASNSKSAPKAQPAQIFRRKEDLLIPFIWSCCPLKRRQNKQWHSNASQVQAQFLFLPASACFCTHGFVTLTFVPHASQLKSTVCSTGTCIVLLLALALYC